MQAKIAVEKVCYSADILYTYDVPENIQNKIKCGSRVVVPFGRGDAVKQGIVMQICDDECVSKRTKNILALLDDVPFVSDEMLDIIKWMKKRYFCCYFDAAKVVLPAGLVSGISGVKYDFDSSINIETLSPEDSHLVLAINNLGKKIISLKDIISLGQKNYGESLVNLIALGILQENLEKSETVGQKSVVVLELSPNFIDCKFTPKQTQIVNFLQEHKSLSMANICRSLNVSAAVVNLLVKKGVIVKSKSKIYASPADCFENYDEYKQDFSLSNNQKKVFEDMLTQYESLRPQVALLHGVTGSGKTMVLLKMIDYVIAKGKSVIFMLPEIALTAQFIKLFKAKYKNEVAVLHSGLTNWQRFDYWRKINSGKMKVVVGTRSAIFAPLQNLGLVIADEEHEFTYKSESDPKYNAKELAAYRCLNNKAMLILSSATPSVESYYKAINNKYALYTLSNRYGNSNLPETEIIDMNKEVQVEGNIQFSRKLADMLTDNFKNHKQSIILINRRGYNTLAKCADCGEVASCPNCSVSLVYHKSGDKLMCHCCGYFCKATKLCQNCGKNKVCYLGVGTQRAEENLQSILPKAKILRLDADVKNSVSQNELLQKFADGEYDVLIGTQIIAKGFNFPGVNLAAILSADQSLYCNDFRSYEKTFSLLTQLIGRAGRFEEGGRAVIQTFTPENEVIHFAAEQNYSKFFENEIKIRKMMLYPPFADICVLTVVSKNEALANNISLKFFEFIKNLAQKKYSPLPLRIFPPVSAVLKKVAKKYRYKIMVKCKNNSEFRRMIDEALTTFKCNSSAIISVDINPDMIL